jgi:hypothetical protein
MALNYSYSGGYNTFIPTTDATATGGLIVEFSRSPDKFHLNKYTQLQQVEVEAGKYWRFDANAMARTYTSDGSQFIWADSADRPAQNMWAGFELPAYVTQRLNFGFLLGDLATYHAKKAGGVDLVAVNSKVVAGGAMLQRTRKAIARLTDSNVISTVSVAAGGTIGNYTVTAGQYWDQGFDSTGAATTAAYLRTGITAVCRNIVQLTNAMIQPKDICMILGPDTASQLGASNEITDLVKQSPFAMANLERDQQFAAYGLPSQLFGVQVIVEDSSYVSTKPGSNAQTRANVVPYGTIIFASRPGSIEGSIMSFSTCMGFFLEEMSVEVFDEPQHRRTSGNVVDNYDYQITAPISGFQITHAVSGS